MRRSVMSSVSSFSMGLSYSAIGAVALFAAYNYWAPPEDSVKASPRVELGAEAAKRMLASFDAKDDLATGGTRQKWADTEPRRELVRGIQRELSRVGCYHDAVDGVWSDNTLGAMKAFNRSVRVDIAVDGPDYILLTLLQGQRSTACGHEAGVTTAKAQPRSAQSPPSAVVPPQLAPPSTWVTVTTAPVTPAVAPQAVRPVPGDKASSTVARIEAPVTIDKGAPIERQAVAGVRTSLEPSVTTASASAKVAPPAGRMAIGGPIAAPDVAETSSLASAGTLGTDSLAPAQQQLQPPRPRAAAAQVAPRRSEGRGSFTRDIFANISRNSP